MTKIYNGAKRKLLANLTGYPDIDNFLDECLETMRVKGHDYRQGNDDDLLHNFRTVAETVGVPIEKVWFTYFYKHYSAMATFIKEGGQQESEPIEGRIKDQIVYLLLFYRMVQERKNKGIKITAPFNIEDMVAKASAEQIKDEVDEALLEELEKLSKKVAKQR